MGFEHIKGLSPAMQGKYWNEIITKEQRQHLYHSQNTPGYDRSNCPVPAGNPSDFYAGTWKMMSRRYDQAAGCPSPLVLLAQRYTGIEPRSEAISGSRPATGLSAGSRPGTGSRRGQSFSVPPTIMAPRTPMQ
eukprot:gnl/TRDRNA2_/TRDRNA2_186831_c0_seq1.p1 gnl/TRDRNA2_/TRDRNA2_186831_c0~~gnl/TRDRNA2_/TRDRNA2_186831_c0_seq1.p1  ORF type:complete len:133 (+),score=13.38 gnl/TRDRNA2_/TRDRNA2_186831_c0_seq1:115-513(+)